MTVFPPLVSVVMACRNVGRFLDAALASVRQQSLAAIEILLVDDGSTDDTAHRARAHAAADPRLRLLEGCGEGPGAARNRALAVARGEWLAVMDGDDLIHPRRLEILLAAAGAAPVEIVADTLLAFQAGPPGRRHAATLPAGPDWLRPVEIDLATYLRANRLFAGGAALGYLKPLIRRDWLAARGIRYDPGLRIGEDYDLIARALAAGARFRVVPPPLYFYRRHAGSTSYRMRAADVAALAAAGDRFLAGLPAGPARAAAEARQDSLVVAWHFSTTVEALKQRRPDRAAAACLGRPRAGLLLALAL
ncbi:glycosyltransferase family 2 protein, partial [Phaeospirillum tilakii]